MDVPLAPSFSSNLPTFVAPMNTNEAISCGNGSKVNLNHAGTTTFREVPSCSASNKGNENFNGDFDFLKLALPDPTSSPHFKSTSTLPSCQGTKENQTPSTSEHSFFTLAAKAAQIGKSTARLQNSNVVGGFDQT
ncbi:hypothetical protein TanjilG_29836 [Lupinus angustifolius]|uniref:Uncharacterized protein n=2 Tax=Lupinus angustifolius TaxID=3871 RepID=A0A4P1RAC5_LUPAN|nr:hypothetical protein TanjilG_29836 [Lupinus angustifolius]